MIARIAGLGALLGLGLAPWIYTQVAAQQLRYASWLGVPLLRVGRLALYAPWQGVVWYWHYSWYYPAPFDWALAAMGMWLVGSAVCIAVLLKRVGWQRQSTTSDADWATAREIRKAGLCVRIRR